MKRMKYFIMIIAALAVVLPVTIISCDKEEEPPETTISLDITQTDPLDIGDTASVVVSIVAGEVAGFQYYKVVDEVKSDPVSALSSLVQDGDDYTYTFSYVLQEGDDLHTLGFEFEVTDGEGTVLTAAVLVQTNLSIRGSFIKYDWRITDEDWLGIPVLASHDSAKIFRFSEDGTYQVDLSSGFTDYAHHFCYWVYKETPGYGDTLAILRLIRKFYSSGVGTDEYYDFQITAADEDEMTMFWDLAVFGLLDIQRTFTSLPKGAFQPYGTVENADSIAEVAAAVSSFDCPSVANSLLTIDIP